MSEPLGRYAGNWLEVLECVDIMQGRRHPLSQDLIHLTNTLAGWMLHLAGQAYSPEEGYLVANKLLATGEAWRSWLQIVAAQGGDTSVFNHPEAFHQAAAKATITAEDKGYVAAMDCTQAGWAVQRLGAGRAKPGGPVSAHAGIEVHVKVGERVKPSQPLVTLYAEDESLLAEPVEMLRTVYRIAQDRPQEEPLIREMIRA
jgi:pyrimidine-nucleoside phosphorylase